MWVQNPLHRANRWCCVGGETSVQAARNQANLYSAAPIGREVQLDQLATKQREGARCGFRIPYTVPTVGAVLGVRPPFKLQTRMKSSALKRPQGAESSHDRPVGTVQNPLHTFSKSSIVSAFLQFIAVCDFILSLHCFVL